MRPHLALRTSDDIAHVRMLPLSFKSGQLIRELQSGESCDRKQCASCSTLLERATSEHLRLRILPCSSLHSP